MEEILKIKCEICWEHIANTTPARLQQPFRGDMFDSPDEPHGFPIPFPPDIDWDNMRCPYCIKRPFVEEGRFWLMEGTYFDIKKPWAIDPSKPDDMTQKIRKLEDALIPLGAQDLGVSEIVAGYVCPYCGKHCKHAQALKWHMKSHK